MVNFLLEQIINDELGNSSISFQTLFSQQAWSDLQELKHWTSQLVRSGSVFHKDGYNFACFCHEALETRVLRGNKIHLGSSHMLVLVEVYVLFYCKDERSDSSTLSLSLVSCKTNQDNLF